MAEVTTRFGVTYADVPLLQTLTDGEGDSLENDVVLSDTEQHLVLSVTLEQYTKLLSAALNGANRHWPDNYIEVIYPLIKAGKVSGSICTAIAECIADSESGTYSALEDWLLDQLQNNTDVTNIINGAGGDQSTPIAANSAELGADCDLDILYGFTSQLTGMMNTVVTDFYQKLEEKSNFVEVVGIVSAQVPVVSQYVSYVEFILDSVRDAYLSNYDLAYEQEVACGLFCLAQDNANCSLTWEEVTDYFAGRISATSALETLSDLLVFIVAGSWSGTEFCDLSLLVFAFIMRIGAVWSGIDLHVLQAIVAKFWNDPDSDWVTVCDCGYVTVYDWNQNDHMGWNPVVGQWGVTESWYSSGVPTLQCRIDRTFTAFDGLKQVDAYGIGSIEAGWTLQVTVTHGGGQDILTTQTKTAGQWFGVTLPATRNGVTYIEYLINTADGHSVNIDRMRLSGVGDNPPPEP